jgi:hypothetical protein
MSLKLNQLDSGLRARILSQMEKEDAGKSHGVSVPAPVKVVDKETGRITFKDAPRRLRQDQKPLMNKLESEFYSELKRFHPDTSIRIQAMRFRLGNGIWYKPDFVCHVAEFLQPGAPLKQVRLTAYEVKGPHAFRGGFENLKVAAGLWPEFRWLLVWKDGGVWQEQVILP